MSQIDSQIIEKWKGLDSTERDKFYDKKIFPHVKEIFVERAEHRPITEKQYDALILTVGFSPEPLILSILAAKPQRVGLLHTGETHKLVTRIQNETGLDLHQIQTEQIDGSDTLDIYQKIMALYEKWNRPKSIAFDITGGKKSMVGGAALAGFLLRADIYYVDNHKFIKEFSKP